MAGDRGMAPRRSAIRICTQAPVPTHDQYREIPKRLIRRPMPVDVTREFALPARGPGTREALFGSWGPGMIERDAARPAHFNAGFLQTGRMTQHLENGCASYAANVPRTKLRRRSGSRPRPHSSLEQQ